MRQRAQSPAGLSGGRGWEQEGQRGVGESFMTTLPDAGYAKRCTKNAQRQLPRSTPLTERLDMRSGAIAEPAVELGLVFELLTAGAGDDEELGGDIRQGGHVTP